MIFWIVLALNLYLWGEVFWRAYQLKQPMKPNPWEIERGPEL